MQIEITKATSVKVGEVDYTPTQLEKMKVKDLLKLLPVICDDKETTKKCKRMRKPKLVAKLGCRGNARWQADVVGADAPHRYYRAPGHERNGKPHHER